MVHKNDDAEQYDLVEIAPLSEVFKNVCIECHKSPKQNRYFLVKWDDIQTLRQVSCIRVNDILEIFGETFIEWVEIHPTVDDSEKTEEFIRGEILNDLLLQLLINFQLSLGICLHGSALHHEILENFVQRYVASAYQEIQVIETGWFIFNQYQQQMNCQRDQHFLLSTLIDCAQIWNTISADVIRNDHIDEGYEQIFAIL